MPPEGSLEGPLLFAAILCPRTQERIINAHAERALAESSIIDGLPPPVTATRRFRLLKPKRWCPPLLHPKHRNHITDRRLRCVRSRV